MPNRTVLTISFLLLLLPPGPALSAGDDTKAAIKAFETQMKEADEQGKVRLIEELASSGNPGAAKAIGKFLGNRSTAVRVAAIRAIGRLKDKASFGRLMGMIKPAEKGEPKVLAAILEAIGEFGNKASLKEVAKVGRKYLSRDSEVASAAARALGKIPARQSVDELIKLLGMTYPQVAQTSSKTISAEARALLAKSRPAIVEGLRSLTGWDFRSKRAWENFWDVEQKTWKPGGTEFDLTKVKKWKDPGYQFEVTQPDETWVWSRPTLQNPRSSTRIMMTKAREGVTNAIFWVMAYDLRNFAKLTAEQKREEYEDNYESTWKDIRAESWERGDFRIGKVKGLYHRFIGKDANGSIAIQKNVFVVRNGMMYIIGTWIRSGMPKEMMEARDKALASFRFIGGK